LIIDSLFSNNHCDPFNGVIFRKNAYFFAFRSISHTNETKVSKLSEQRIKNQERQDDRAGGFGYISDRKKWMTFYLPVTSEKVWKVLHLEMVNLENY